MLWVVVVRVWSEETVRRRRRRYIKINEKKVRQPSGKSILDYSFHSELSRIHADIIIDDRDNGVVYVVTQSKYTTQTMKIADLFIMI